MSREKQCKHGFKRTVFGSHVSGVGAPGTFQRMPPASVLDRWLPPECYFCSNIYLLEIATIGSGLNAVSETREEGYRPLSPVVLLLASIGS